MILTTAFVLILVAGKANGVAMEDFGDKASCEFALAAAKNIQSDGFFGHVNGICVAKEGVK
jgi:hypothetical protein